MTAAQSSTMPTSGRQAATALLDPKTLSKISRLDMVARQVMDGYVQGMHKSKHIDFAIDFAQHRQYVPGDDVKRIDWRLLAKSNRYYIKQYEVTTNLRAFIILDCSVLMILIRCEGVLRDGTKSLMALSAVIRPTESC